MKDLDRTRIDGNTYITPLSHVKLCKNLSRTLVKCHGKFLFYQLNYSVLKPNHPSMNIYNHIDLYSIIIEKMFVYLYI